MLQRVLNELGPSPPTFLHILIFTWFSAECINRNPITGRYMYIDFQFISFGIGQVLEICRQQATSFCGFGKLSLFTPLLWRRQAMRFWVALLFQPSLWLPVPFCPFQTVTTRTWFRPCTLLSWLMGLSSSMNERGLDHLDVDLCECSRHLLGQGFGSVEPSWALVEFDSPLD
jgi:hypothetical protein